MMYTIIAGTNRQDSNTLKIARQYEQLLIEKELPVQLLSLEGINPLIRDEKIRHIEDTYLLPAGKFIFIAPEYNGSIPGILKVLIDEAPWKSAWRHKKAMLVGVSTGRAGNLRGLDHLTSILHHMRMHVLPFMLPISQVDQLLGNGADLADSGTLTVMKSQLEEFVAY